MEQSKFNVPQVLSNSQQYAGYDLIVEGWLVANGDIAQLCATPPLGDDTEGLQKLQLVQEDLIPKLFKNVFAIVGGPFYYKDKATVYGRLQLLPEPSLVDLKKLVVHRADGDEIVEF